jgi:hypothetical protein
VSIAGRRGWVSDPGIAYQYALLVERISPQLALLRGAIAEGEHLAWVRGRPLLRLRTVTALEFTDSVLVAAAPDAVYALVSDVTRMGEWSPICTACWWDEPAAGPQVGAWFTGRNETPERTWETRSQVVAADGREFAWEVNNGWVRWGCTLAPEADGTRLTESWAFLPAGIAGFGERFGDDAQAQIVTRTEAATAGIPVTLAAIKRTAEAG